MLKLWLVVRIFGDVAASIGPVSVDMPACQAWAQQTEVVLGDRFDITTPDNRDVKPENITVTCEWSALQPGVR